MRRLAIAGLTAALLAPAPALADLSSHRTGIYLGAGGGSGNGGLPFTGGVGWYGHLGIWVGRYDDDMALGRHWGFAVTARQDWITPPSHPVGLLRTAPMFEIRRGLDLLVVGFSGFIAGGPLLETQAKATALSGGTARIGGNVKWRFHASWGLNLRVEAGVDVFDEASGPIRVGGQLGVTLGIEFAEMFKNKKDHDE